jgi:hypothetical protein
MNDFEELNIEVKNKKISEKKDLIVLCHTYRNLIDYITSLKHRFNGYYDKIPNYIIGIDGKIYKVLDNLEYTNFLDDQQINNRSIIVVLENLGWLNKEPLSSSYTNWIGDIYNGDVLDKKWREYFFWQKYSEEQIVSTGILCKKLSKECGIERNIIGHNTKINGIEKIEGVVSRSNLYSDCTDLNPSFDFELMLKIIENDEFS